jgi:hypothetical protein
VAGGLLGAFAFILAYPALEPLLIKPLDLGKLTLHEMLGLPYLPAAIVVATVLGAIVLWLNRLEARARAQ